MNPVIEFTQVSFSYNGAPVLENVDLTVHEKEFLSLVGPNGGGKTTILKLVLGLIKPTYGTVKVFGNSPVKARVRIGYMPQHASLDPMFPVNVLDVVLMGRLGHGMNMGFYRGKDKKAAQDALRKVEMLDARDKPFSELSGGQAQRVLIARALATSPDLLILDEPTANVDIAVETELYEILKEINKDMTIVLVTHDLGFVSRYVTNVACVNRRVLEHPTCDISGEMIHEIYGSHVHMVRHDAISTRESPRD
ncbi:MAG: metal ABC transporter ATP-binding protein [Desulfomonilia bacterium]